MKIYLAGPINGCTDEECKDWREGAKIALPQHEMIDPMRRDYRGREDQCVSEIVEGDKDDIRESDVVLVNFPKPSVGTSMEVFFAWEIGKHVVVVAPAGKAVSPWMRYHAAHIVNTFKEAYGLLNMISVGQQ